jgi:hypothetical protein
MPEPLEAGNPQGTRPNAALVEWVVERGVAFNVALAFQNEDLTLVDLTGYSARCAFRPGRFDANNMPVALGPVLLTLTSVGTGGGITLVAPPPAVTDPNDPPDTIRLTMTDAQARLFAAGTHYVAALKLVPPSGDAAALQPIYASVPVFDEVTP